MYPKTNFSANSKYPTILPNSLPYHTTGHGVISGTSLPSDSPEKDHDHGHAHVHEHNHENEQGRHDQNCVNRTVLHSCNVFLLHLLSDHPVSS